MEIIFIRHSESTGNIADEKGEAYDTNNVVLTDNGKEQAKITGKYIASIYGPFDMIYSLPITRCKQTAQIIASIIGYDKDIIYDELLIESGEENHKLGGLSTEDQNDILNKHKVLLDMNQMIKDEKNLFKKSELIKVFHAECSKYLDIRPTFDQIVENYTKFLLNLKKDKRILIVVHQGTIEGILSIVTNISIHDMAETIKIVSKQHKDDMSYSNCCIMGIRYEDGNIRLIFPPKRAHLDNDKL